MTNIFQSKIKELEKEIEDKKLMLKSLFPDISIENLSPGELLTLIESNECIDKRCAIFDWIELSQEKAKLQTTKELAEQVEKVIDKIERNNWSCNAYECGICHDVDEQADKCSKCGQTKEKSWDNDKLEELKQALSGELK